MKNLIKEYQKQKTIIFKNPNKIIGIYQNHPIYLHGNICIYKHHKIELHQPNCRIRINCINEEYILISIGNNQHIYYNDTNIYKFESSRYSIIDNDVYFI